MTRALNTLLVDDSPTVRKLIGRALKQTGLAEFTITEANDGIDALAKYQPGQTDIIFVDMNMPRMGGVEFIRKLRSQHKKCPPAVMITAETNKERLLEALNEPGVDAFLLKPVDRDRLRAGLGTLINSIPARSDNGSLPHVHHVPEAVREIFAEACKIELVTEPPNQELKTADIILVLLSVQGDVHWSVLLGFSSLVAAGAASRFAGYDLLPDHPDIGDAIGEIANIVGGRLKALLTAEGVEAVVSFPTVIEATGFQFLLQPKTSAYSVKFNSRVGEVWAVVIVGINAGTVL